MQKELLIFPVQHRQVWSAKAFVKELPNVALCIVESRFGARGRVIFENYLLEGYSNDKALAALASSIGISKQAAHVTFKRIIRRLRENMFEDKYRMCSYRLSSGFATPLKALSRKVKWGSRTVISIKDWNRLLKKIWGLTPTELGPTEPLILELLGLRRLDFRGKSDLDPILASSSEKDSTQFQAAASIVQRALASHHPRGLTFQELTKLIKTCRALSAFAPEKIRALLRCAKYIERIGNRYRIPDRWMSRRADQYHHILLQARRPLHYSELARRAVRFGYYGTGSAFSIWQILSKDLRFATVGKSGYWALRGWSTVEMRTITRIALDELRGARRPLHESELYALVSKQTAVKKRNLRRLLNHSRRIKSVGCRLWTTCA